MNAYSSGMKSVLKQAEQMGRGGDTILAHINPEEAQMLKRLGGSGGRNPMTGLREYNDDPEKSLGDIIVNSQTTEEDEEEEKGVLQQISEFITQGTPINLGGGGVDPKTGETLNNSTTTTSDSGGVTEAEAEEFVTQVVEAEDPLEAFNEWMNSTFEDSQIRLSPKTIAQIQYMSQMLLGKAEYSQLSKEEIDQAYSDTFVFDEDRGVYVYQPSGGGEETILMDNGQGQMVYANFNETTGSFEPTETPYNVLSGYDGTGILSKEYAKNAGIRDGIMNHLFGTPTGDNGAREGGVFSKLSSAADGSIKVKTGESIYGADGETLAEGYELVPGQKPIDPVTPEGLPQLQELFPDAQINNPIAGQLDMNNLPAGFTVSDTPPTEEQSPAKTTDLGVEIPSLRTSYNRDPSSFVKEMGGDGYGQFVYDADGNFVGITSKGKAVGEDEVGIITPESGYTEFAQFSQGASVVIDQTTYTQQGDGTFQDSTGNTLQTDGSTATAESYTFNGQPIEVDSEGNVIEESTVYDRVENVVSELLDEGGAIDLAEQDIDNMRDMGQAIADIGDRFGAYTTDSDGNPVYNPQSFEARFAEYETQLVGSTPGEGGIAQDYQEVINRLRPYESLTQDLASDYDEVGAQYREMFNESRSPTPYRNYLDLLYSDAADQVQQSAQGVRETLNTQFAQSGMSPNSPAYTSALMELENNRTNSLQQARRQAAIDSFNMGAQAMSNSASLLGGVERSLAGRGTAYGMGINTLLSEGNLISNKANALMQGVGLLGQQAGAAIQQAELYNTSAGISANAANSQLAAGGQAINFANAGVGNVGNYLTNQLAATNPYITMSPLVTNYGQSILNNINTLTGSSAQTSGDIDISNATNNIIAND